MRAPEGPGELALGALVDVPAPRADPFLPLLPRRQVFVLVGLRQGHHRDLAVRTGPLTAPVPHDEQPDQQEQAHTAHDHERVELAVRLADLRLVRRSSARDRWRMVAAKPGIHRDQAGLDSASEVPLLEQRDHALGLHHAKPAVRKRAFESVPGLHLQPTLLDRQQHDQPVVGLGIAHAPQVEQLGRELLGRPLVDRGHRDDGDLDVQTRVHRVDASVDRSLVVGVDDVGHVTDPATRSRIRNIGRCDGQRRGQQGKPHHSPPGYGCAMSTTSTREALRRRPDVPNEDIDDIIARASELQDADRAHDADHATVAEVEAVAEELDIDASYVEKAINAIRADRLEQASIAKNRTRWLSWIGMGLVALGLVFGGGIGAGAVVGSARLGPVAEQVDTTAAKLDQALDRQAALAPQLVALAGGEIEAVSVAAETAKSAEDLPARLEAAEGLNLAMAEAIGKIEAQGNDQAQQRLLNLQYEVVGTWNRIDTERGRHDEAVAAWTRVAESMTGRMALATGMAQGR